MMYGNANDFIVILADDRDPDVSWSHHLERGSLGGVDCVAPMRTPVYAPADGKLDSALLGTGGLTARVHQDAGWRDELMHMDEVLSPRTVRYGDLIGYSGASGGNYAPHVHWHRVDPNGNRQNPWHYFNPSAPAGGDSTLIPTESEEDEMNPFLIWKRNPDGTRQWAQVSGDLARMVKIWKLETANGLGARFGPAIEVVQQEWDGYAAAAGIKP